jgi:hypothetical protein
MALLLVEQHLPLKVEEEEVAEKRMAWRQVPSSARLREVNDPPPCSPLLMLLNGFALWHQSEEVGVDAVLPSAHHVLSGMEEATGSSPSILLQ